MKTCRICKEVKPLTEYHTEPKNSDGHRNECKECRRANQRERRKNRDIYTKASNIFSGITQRCTNEKRLNERPTYKNISNLLDKNEFIEWYVKNYFDGCEVDRIDNDKNYSMDNIQLLSRVEHNKKKATTRIFLEQNKCVCNKCKKEYTYDGNNFLKRERLKSKYNPLGIVESCNECNRTKGIKL